MKSPRYGIVVSRFNREITEALLQGALSAFRRGGVLPRQVDVLWVPGAFELPVAALKMAKSKRYQGIVALGCILAGETPQFTYLSHATYQGLALAGVTTGVPVTSGVITAKTFKQALARSQKRGLNRGAEAARAALEMARLFKNGSSHAR